VIVVLFGADALGLRRRLQQIKDEADGGTGMLTTNMTVIDGREAKPDDIIGPAMMPPFLAPRRLVLVEGLIDRFEPRDDGRPARSVEVMAPLLAAFEAGIPESSTIVITGGPRKRASGARRNALLDRLRSKAMEKNVIVEEFPEIKGEALIRYIRDEAAARGIRFRSGGSRAALVDGSDRPRESDPATLLAALLQSDTLAIASELDKLALYSMGRDVTVDDVAAVSAGDREAKVFDFIDGTMDGDLRKAFSALALLRRDGDSVQRLLTLLTNGYRTAATIIDMLDEGATADEIGTAIHQQRYPGLRDKAIARARRIGPRGVRAAYAAIVETDRSTKLGEVDADLAFDLLVMRLSTLSAPATSRR